MKREYWIGAGVVALLVLGYLFLPVWQAWQRYETAGGGRGSCMAARDLADAWGSIGFGSRRMEWEHDLPLICLREERIVSEGGHATLDGWPDEATIADERLRQSKERLRQSKETLRRAMGGP